MHIASSKSFTLKYPKYSNLLIFGHSLNEQDYQDFYSMFDDIGLLDSKSNGHIVFCYYVYDKKNENSIVEKYKSSAIDLINAYEDYKQNNGENDLFNNLYGKKRIAFLEILPIDVYFNKLRLNHFVN